MVRSIIKPQSRPRSTGLTVSVLNVPTKTHVRSGSRNLSWTYKPCAGEPRPPLLKRIAFHPYYTRPFTMSHTAREAEITGPKAGSAVPLFKELERKFPYKTLGEDRWYLIAVNAFSRVLLDT